MPSGYLDLAYLIEISVVFNLAYREIKHGSVLEKMKRMRVQMSKDQELQERINAIKKDTSLAGDAVESSYMELVAIIECDEKKSKDCKNTDSSLCKAWKHNESHCEYFTDIILTGKGLLQVNWSILISLIILFFATVFPHLPAELLEFSILAWFALFFVLIATICIPIYSLVRSEKIGYILMGKNGQTGLIEELEQNFNNNYNQYLKEKAEKITP
jgi:hypothetical protein